MEHILSFYSRLLCKAGGGGGGGGGGMGRSWCAGKQTGIHKRIHKSCLPCKNWLKIYQVYQVLLISLWCVRLNATTANSAFEAVCIGLTVYHFCQEFVVSTASFVYSDASVA